MASSLGRFLYGGLDSLALRVSQGGAVLPYSFQCISNHLLVVVGNSAFKCFSGIFNTQLATFNAACAKRCRNKINAFMGDALQWFNVSEREFIALAFWA